MEINVRNVRIIDFLKLRQLRQDKEVSERLEHSNFIYFLLEIWKIITFNKPIRKVILYNNQIIGIINLINIRKKSAEIGYFIGKDYWNKGIATEAIKQMVNFGFSKLELKKIYAYCDPKNISSQKVLIKNKFVKKKNTKDNRVYLEKNNNTNL